MAVKIRLARHGRKNRPIYSLLAAESTCKRDGRFIKKLGTYDPNKHDDKLVVTDLHGLKKYLACGAQPTEIVARLIKNII